MPAAARLFALSLPLIAIVLPACRPAADPPRPDHGRRAGGAAGGAAGGRSDGDAAATGSGGGGAPDAGPDQEVVVAPPPDDAPADALSDRSSDGCFDAPSDDIAAADVAGIGGESDAVQVEPPPDGGSEAVGVVAADAAAEVSAVAEAGAVDADADADADADGMATSDAPPAVASCDGSVVISQIYSRGGNAGAVYAHDFVELHNRGRAAVMLAGWSIQYASAGGGSWAVTVLPGSVLPGGGYLLIEEASGGASGSALPATDATGTINLGGASGKVALVAGAAPLAGACPAAGEVIDLVGYGDASCFEGSPAAAPPTSSPIARLGDGCADSDRNGEDLVPGGPGPRSSAAAPMVCRCGLP